MKTRFKAQCQTKFKTFFQEPILTRTSLKRLCKGNVMAQTRGIYLKPLMVRPLAGLYFGHG